MKKTILYQGVPGAFSHIAATGYFGSGHEFHGNQTFFDIFQHIGSTQTTYGVLPVENSLAGSIYENYDLLYKYNVSVTGEYYQRIQHHLLGIPDPQTSTAERLSAIRTILSHPKALEQCVQFFRKNKLYTAQAFSDTAEAARYISEKMDPSLGAIASEEAARMYGLSLLRRDIQDNPNNWTRFLIVTGAQRDQDILEHDSLYKCSLMFTLPHKPGSLHTALGMFANAHLNLSKIESRPIHGTAFEYVFSVDVEFHSHDYAVVRDLVADFSEFVNEVKVLGYYRKAHIKTDVGSP
jgi:prephenate dehydratase